MQLYNSNEAVVSARSMPRDIAKLCAHFILCMIVSAVGAIGTGFAVFALSVNQATFSPADTLMSALTVFSLSLCLSWFSQSWGKTLQSISLLSLIVLATSSLLLFFY